ncbi:MAG: alkylmercury lyase family protein [Chloroflexi bacterium]|nr:alkylmercury lyase family protein [Chloroflexota bacterium]
MLIFRSEEHLEKWLKDWHMPKGAILSLEQCWQLAQEFYGPDRRAPEWRRKTLDEI